MATKDISDRQVCEVVRDYAARGPHGPMHDAALMALTGQPIKVVMCALERAYGHGLIECGVSVRTAWLTDKGKALLAGVMADFEGE